MKKIILLLILVSSLWSCNQSKSWLDLNGNGKKDVYEDVKRPLKTRVNDLLSRMTLEEKISQMGATSPAIEHLGIKKYLWRNEALHGIVAKNDHYTTVFPQSIGLASTWNPQLVREEATAISDEARALATLFHNEKYLNFWSPMINMARDPRWGRTQEGYGEDPFLVSTISTEFVKGLQGNDKKYFKVLATPKHFIANNVDWNRHFGNSKIDDKLLHDYYLQAFKKCVVDGHAQAIMAAYNALNGVPCCCNQTLLQDILRNGWGFDGHVVSDCGAIYNIYANHKYVKTAEEAVAISVKSGTDLNCGPRYQEFLKSSYNQGYIDEETINNAVRRILKARFQLGMFDPQEMVRYTKIPQEVIASKSHKALAKQVALESIILLKNENNFLPLSKNIKSIAVIGPNAAVCQLGDYSGTPDSLITPLEAIRRIVSDTTKVRYAPGTVLYDNNLPPIPNKYFIPPGGKPGVHGLRGEYFNNMNFEGNPVLIRIDANLNHRWWEKGSFPDSIVNSDHFSVRWTGKIVPDKSERYLISASTNVMSSKGDKGIRLYLDGEKIIDQWRDHNMHASALTKELKAGKDYDIRVEYVDDIDWQSVVIGWKPCGKNLIAEAVNVAKKSDAVILIAGTNNAHEGELHDRNTLDLPEDQKILIQRILAANPNTCLVLVNGSPLSINWEKENIPAIVEAWFPGEEGGNAIADILFGDYNPGGKLPITFYTGIEQLPPFEDYDLTKGRTYMYLKEEPLLPFGYGLSYTRFEVSNYVLEKGNLSTDDVITVSFDLENVGDMKGSEVVQLYVHEHNDSKYTPIKILKAFKRVFLEAGEKQRVTLKVPVKELATYSLEEKAFVTNPGTYDIMVGNSSEFFHFREEIKVTD